MARKWPPPPGLSDVPVHRVRLATGRGLLCSVGVKDSFLGGDAETLFLVVHDRTSTRCVLAWSPSWGAWKWGPEMVSILSAQNGTSEDAAMYCAGKGDLDLSSNPSLAAIISDPLPIWNVLSVMSG